MEVNTPPHSTERACRTNFPAGPLKIKRRVLAWIRFNMPLGTQFHQDFRRVGGPEGDNRVPNLVGGHAAVRPLDHAGDRFLGSEARSVSRLAVSGSLAIQTTWACSPAFSWLRGTTIEIPRSRETLPYTMRDSRKCHRPAAVTRLHSRCVLFPTHPAPPPPPTTSPAPHPPYPTYVPSPGSQTPALLPPRPAHFSAPPQTPDA